MGKIEQKSFYQQDTNAAKDIKISFEYHIQLDYTSNDTNNKRVIVHIPTALDIYTSSEIPFDSNPT